MSAPVDPHADVRAARRAFVRTHHPDVGGDPVAFREGLAALRAHPAPDDPRLDAPIVVVPAGRLARLGRFGRRLTRRRRTARVL
ncbi:hypothetical protein [Actinomycetospora aeridis]|uniref:J domain-containing protein n=1 Tax=Actinomycetospora aeridis TaxID=3129231 RepID=A0ABU8N3B8_9PSEU